MTDNVSFGEARELLLKEAANGTLVTEIRSRTTACLLQELEPGENTPAWDKSEWIE